MSQKSTLRRVGVLGGMGPAATHDLLGKVLALTPAVRDQDHVPLVIWNVPQVEPRLPALRGEGPSPLPAMLEGARALEACGCEALAIACNTAHHWAAELQAGVSIPLLHIADAALDEIERERPGTTRVALLATRGTLASGFYRERLAARGVEALAPGEALQQEVDRAIEHVKRNEVALARETLTPVVRRMLEGGAQAVVLACTELPLAAPPAGTDVPIVDPTRALARAIVGFSLGSPCGPGGRQVS